MVNYTFNLFLHISEQLLCDLDLLSLTIQQYPESLAGGKDKVTGFPKELRLTIKHPTIHV